MKKEKKIKIKKKDYMKLKDVEELYKIIYKYNLREKAYIILLRFYIKYYKKQIENL